MTQVTSAFDQAQDIARSSNLHIVTLRNEFGDPLVYRVWRGMNGAPRAFVGQRTTPEALLALVKRAAGSKATT